MRASSGLPDGLWLLVIVTAAMAGIATWSEWYGFAVYFTTLAALFMADGIAEKLK